jgi:serine/threonine protein kinase
MMALDENRRSSPPLSFEGPNGAGDPHVTTAYTAAARPPAGAAAQTSPPASPRRFDFLGPPRAEDELGWLAHYRVRGLVGEGGIGLVFLADDTQLARSVALKVIKPEMAGAPGVMSRFLREAQATAAIKHDHIVTIYQVGRDNDTLFLAMEYLRGLSLHAWLERGRTASIDLVLRIGREIASGLAAAHRAGLIHRDIKPANIWLEAPSGRVKILDFGMARSERDDVHVTQSGAVIGTPAYMAPEQARGETVGPACDLFSLGCVLYRLCAGRLPFEGPTIMATLSAISSQDPQSPRLIEPEVPAALDELVMRLLAKDPAERPASAQAVVSAIRSIERELSAERQRADFAEVAALTDADWTMCKPSTIDPPVDSGAPAQARTTPRAPWMMVAMCLIAAAAVLGGFALATSRHSTRSELAGQPTLARASGEPSVRDGETPAPERPEVQPPRAVTEHDARPEDRGGGPGATALPPADQSLVNARGDADGAPGGPEVAGRVPGLALADRNTAPQMQPEDTRPETEKSEPNGQPRKPGNAEPGREGLSETVVPDGDCKIEMDRAGNTIAITLPGTPHALSAEIRRMNAPRLLRAVKGDFDARVRVTGVFHPAGRSTVKEYAPYHGAGILLWQDAENYVRLEIAADVHHGRPRPYANFEYRRDGALAVSRGLKIVDGSSYLRLKRRGNEIYAAFGPDGITWTSFPPLSVMLQERLEVGIVAINTATKPLTARLEGFEVSEMSGAGPAGIDGSMGPRPPFGDSPRANAGPE